MGKARILSAQGEGLYSIEILEDRSRAESLKTRNQQRITEIDSELTDLEQDLSDAQVAVDVAAQMQDATIADYQAEPTGDHRQAMTEAAQALLEAAEVRDALRVQISHLNTERVSRQFQVDRVDALPALRQQDAWCADYTEDLDGEVGTAEVPGEVGEVIIRPGFEDGASWSASEDGVIQPALSGTPASVFYNLAMMPGWQKWRPTFRIATISNIDNDLCDIALDPTASSQKGLSVNAQTSYSGVPIMYMDCNGEAFEEGDRVLVAFSGNTQLPMVVGFETSPRQCCSCDPIVIATSPESGSWHVSAWYGALPITACSSDMWRIIASESQEVVAEGGLKADGGVLYMDGLPEELETSHWEVVGVWSGCSPPDVPFNETTTFLVTFPEPDPVFHGGEWGFEGTSGGYGGAITESGGIFDPFINSTMTSYYFVWGDGAGCGTVELVYRSPQLSFELQLGCKQSDGSVWWPS